MPRLNRTGPEGKGPRTGLGNGRCGPRKEEDRKEPDEATAETRDEKEPAFGAGRGFGRGWGRGAGRRRGRGGAGRGRRGFRGNED